MDIIDIILVGVGILIIVFPINLGSVSRKDVMDIKRMYGEEFSKKVDKAEKYSSSFTGRLLFGLFFILMGIK